jgi:hypothetical protein
MSSADFAKMVPGFDFLQSLMKNAGSALPGMGQWIAPTLNPEELEKRIEELRTVQFWLEQNARMLGATIQALEVQRMTPTPSGSRPRRWPPRRRHQHRKRRRSQRSRASRRPPVRRPKRPPASSTRCSGGAR